LSILFIFFFSSRRRHTRLQGDWSSDVCSSDLSSASSFPFSGSSQHKTKRRSERTCHHLLLQKSASSPVISLPRAGRFAMGSSCRSEERRVGKECRSRWWP